MMTVNRFHVEPDCLLKYPFHVDIAPVSNVHRNAAVRYDDAKIIRSDTGYFHEHIKKPVHRVLIDGYSGHR